MKVVTTICDKIVCSAIFILYDEEFKSVNLKQDIFPTNITFITAVSIKLP